MQVLIKEPLMTLEKCSFFICIIDIRGDLYSAKGAVPCTVLEGYKCLKCVRSVTSNESGLWGARKMSVISDTYGHER